MIAHMQAAMATSTDIAGHVTTSVKDIAKLQNGTSSQHTSATVASTNGSTAHKIDLQTWPGWVELESEPAYFNVMLKEIGVSGVKVQDVIGLDEELLGLLPQPVHALIFLFKYKDSKRGDPNAEFPEAVWFARQTAHNACATHALLNIVNNIPDLIIGDRLEAFKAATSDMTPLERGNQLDQLHFVRAVHNSFASENDLIAADQHLQGVIDKARKQAAAVKANKAKSARAALKAKQSKTKTTAATALNSRATRSTARNKNAAGIDQDAATIAKTPTTQTKRTTDATKSSEQGAKSAATAAQSTKRKHDDDNDHITSASEKQAQCTTDPSMCTVSDHAHVAEDIAAKSSGKRLKLLNTMPARKQDPHTYGLRSSARRRKPVLDEEAAYHFCAYMPIHGRLWKLDGLEPTPEDIGQVNDFDSWLDLAVPALRSRMADYEADSIEFNLMAVVHDPFVTHQDALKQNIKSIVAVEAKLATVAEDWYELKGEESREVINGTSERFAISQADINETTQSIPAVVKLEASEDLSDLLELRKKLVQQQAAARGVLRDELEVAKYEAEQAFHRRHDYSSFIRGWMEELVKEDVLAKLIEGNDSSNASTVARSI